MEVPSICVITDKDIVYAHRLIGVKVCRKTGYKQVDVDYAEADRDKLLNFLLEDKLNLPNVQTAHIITFNTIALKGAIKDIGRGLGMSIEETTEISEAVYDVADDENRITTIGQEWRDKYPQLFKYVDAVIGTIVSIGSHPSGILVTDREIDDEICSCYLKDNPYPVSCLNMKELDSLNYVKFDCLGLDNVDIINTTCKLAGIDRVSAKTVDIEDDNVWRSIQNDTDLIFQVSGNFGSKTIGKIFSPQSMGNIFGRLKNFTRMDLFSFTNALLRPCGKSVYEDATNGIAHITGVKEVDDTFESELGYPLFQETQMEFVMKFCGYSFLEADHLRKCIAEGSLVAMADGTLKPIEDVRVGDRIISFDGMEFVEKPVTAVWDNGVKEVVEILLDNGVSLRCTPDHKLLTQNGWKEVREFLALDKVAVLENTPFPIPHFVKALKRVGLSKVYDLTVEDTHNFVANDIICHNCIAKKIGTKEQLPIIEKAFYEHGKKDLNLTDEQAQAVIQPFLRCILDATRYSFCRIHAYSYSYIGYICAYLRYYYPLEYLTACLNVWQTKEEKTRECMEYAKKVGVRVEEPVFGHGQSSYSFDKATKTVYKGMKSIKFLNEACSEYLYSLRNNHYDSFTDLLYQIANDKVSNARQLDVLIRLDFFRNFGNSNEITKIIQMFRYFKNGTAVSVKKEKVENNNVVSSIISRHSKETAKTFTKLDTPAILNECEDYIKSQHFPDFSIKEKALSQKELLGYINMYTGENADRPKILVLNHRILTSKKTGKPWAVALEGQSLGSGKKTKYTIMYGKFTREKFNDYDVIYIDDWSNKRGYFYIDKYHMVY